MRISDWSSDVCSSDLASDGILLPHWDKAQLQRGMQVYREVCSACHSLNLVAFRDIQDLGYTEGQVKTFAKGFQVPSINPDTGEPATRDGMPSDYFPSPYANEVAARAANNNALPPDLSLITKAREGGKDYIYSLLTGFQNPPKNLPAERSEEHTSELQSLMRISYAVFCLKKKNKTAQ